MLRKVSGATPHRGQLGGNTAVLGNVQRVTQVSETKLGEYARQDFFYLGGEIDVPLKQPTIKYLVSKSAKRHCALTLII